MRKNDSSRAHPKHAHQPIGAACANTYPTTKSHRFKVGLSKSKPMKSPNRGVSLQRPCHAPADAARLTEPWHGRSPSQCCDVVPSKTSPLSFSLILLLISHAYLPMHMPLSLLISHAYLLIHMPLSLTFLSLQRPLLPRGAQ